MRKSLGGDVFTVSWTSAGRKEAPMTGLVWTRCKACAALCSFARSSSASCFFTGPATSQM